MSTANLFRIPRSLAAPTRDKLGRLMLLNNFKHSIEFRYFDIQFVNGEWIAWYNVILDKEKLLARAEKGVK